MISASVFPAWVRKLVEHRIVEIAEGNRNSAEFRASEASLRAELYKRVHKYQEFCLRYRRKHGLTPFSWDRETECRVKACFKLRHGKPILPRTYASAEMARVKGIELTDKARWWRSKWQTLPGAERRFYGGSK
jgi:hypothetical protein